MTARILVVDDDPWILRMVSASLKKREFVVDTAREGRQALERARAHAPDVIISDVMMPVMDGWTFVQQLRQDPRLAAIPVIFLTALGKDQAKLRALGLTEQDYLAKPFRFDDLEKRVDAALAGRGGQTPMQGGYPPQGPNQNSGLHPLPGYPPQGPNPNSGLHPLPGYPPQGPNQGSGLHPLPGYPPQGPNPNSGVHPMPMPPYGYPQQGQYPGQYPPQPGQYPPQPGQYPPQPGQYPPQPGQYPPQYGYPGQYPPPQYGYPGQYPPPGAYPGGPPPAPPAAAPPPAPESTAARNRRATALHGRIEQLGLSSLLVMMEMERKQGVLSMCSENEIVGRVYLRGGQVVAAHVDDQPELPGRECVYRLLAWKSGTFSFSATTVDVEDTVQSSTTHLLMEGARLIDEAGRDDEGL